MRATTGFDELARAITGRLSRLSKRMRQIGTYALAHPDQMGIGTIETVARRMGAAPSSLVRFAQGFGFRGYTDMQRVFRLGPAIPMLDQRARLQLVPGAPAPIGPPGAPKSVLEELVRADIAGLEHLRKAGQHRQLGQIATMVDECEVVYLVASLASFPVTCYFSYALANLGVRNVLVSGVGGMAVEQLSFATAKDLLLAVESDACPPEVLQAVREVSERGVPIAVLSGSVLSPLARHACACLQTHHPRGRELRSLAVPMTLAVALVVAVGRLSGRSVERYRWPTPPILVSRGPCGRELRLRCSLPTAAEVPR